LVFDKLGNIYGSTLFGGGLGPCNTFYGYCGTIFELSPPATEGSAWTEKVLFSFSGGSDGALPNGGLILDAAGAVYGTAQYGGNSGCSNSDGTGCGVVFKLTPSANRSGSWTESLLYSFNPTVIVGDGAVPLSGLVFDKKGMVYGTTGGGGTAKPTPAGIIFRLSPSQIASEPWTESVLFSFGTGRTGGILSGGLSFDARGNIYGTTREFGLYGGGTAYLLKPPAVSGGKWTYDVLHQFNLVPDAAAPTGDLSPGKYGKIYGTAEIGGTGTNCSYGGCGAVFEIQP
jgi:hypothetical protein